MTNYIPHSASTPVTINAHPMVTRGKNGIFKKRAYLASTYTSDPVTTEPYIYLQKGFACPGMEECYARRV